MSSKNSKFSGIFAQTRSRDAADEMGDESPQTDTDNVEKATPTSPEPTGPARKNKATKPAQASQTEAASAAGRPRGKRSDPDFTQITAYISKTTHQNIKIALLNEGKKREISELIEERLSEWLREQIQSK